VCGNHTLRVKSHCEWRFEIKIVRVYFQLSKGGGGVITPSLKTEKQEMTGVFKMQMLRISLITRSDVTCQSF
jgi:hypothetical protein